MGFVERRHDPSPKDLRVFGFLLVAFAAVFGGMVLWRTGSMPAARGIWIAGAALSLLHFAVPALRWPLYTGWMALAFPIGWAVSHLLLTVVFYLLITPFGFVMRLFGYDPMRRKRNLEATTYWSKLDIARDTGRYFRQS